MLRIVMILVLLGFASSADAQILRKRWGQNLQTVYESQTIQAQTCRNCGPVGSAGSIAPVVMYGQQTVQPFVPAATTIRIGLMPDHQNTPANTTLGAWPGSQERVVTVVSEKALESVVGTGFRAEVLRAIPRARKAGKITLQQAFELRRDMLSPAFVEAGQQLALTQMVFSGQTPELVPRDDSGAVQVGLIKWENLQAFIEALIPFLMELRKLFGL